ncbi:transglutaminase-like domain-containing protein [Microbacterium invictum]|uniref:MFS family permease n=1 Tax=Microbacterium invictum TaxID=515415 RepID=A0AA40VMX2_9MICO|nr:MULTISPECIES: transglutaminase-like domain-containing protein [Microbacterium]MBB4140149.1 MFS family permease [Microbacterium invictum]
MTTSSHRVIAGTAWVAVIVVIAAVAAWPIYRTSAFLTLVAVASVLALAVATLVHRRGWGGWAVAGILAVIMFVVGVPLAVPSRVGGPAELLRGLEELAGGVVLGWKDLVTVDLPVGSYRNLLVPALVIFLVGTTVLLLLVWRADRWAYAAVPVSIAMVAFGLLFGRTTVSAPFSLGPVTLAAPVETAIGIAALVAGVLWMSWRARDERRGALQRAAESSGVRLRRSSRVESRRVALGAGMVALAAVAVTAVVPAVAQSADRDVLRTAIGPEVEMLRAVSPLSGYRSIFGDDTFDEVMFTVTGEQLPDRVRLATLDVYDGVQFRTDVAGDAAQFTRVPSTLDAGEGEPVDVEIELGILWGLWMPTVGRVASIDFEGTRGAALADGFYYSGPLAAAVQTVEWAPGDRYRLRGVLPETPPLVDIDAPGGVTRSVELPASMRTWIDDHVAGSGGVALADLVRLLRERGYLSHALEIDGGAEWVTALDGYTFVPSAAGHSLARIGDMFTALLESDAAVGAQGPAAAVAAVGDDEQFATAVALIAQDLGFPARVVLGARLQSTDAGLSTCEDGACRAGDITAWVEVRSSGGQWVPVDVTPQHTLAPDRTVVEQPDPRVPTEVRPDSVEEVVPPRPAQEDTARTDRPADPVDLEWLWATLRIGSIVALVAALPLAPFLTILFAKATRRAGRRRGDPVARIAGGWEEYVDAAVDAGLMPPQALTRVETADAYGAEHGRRLAVAADEAVFSAGTTTADEADEFWRIVDAERRTWSTGLWQRLRAAVSLRSFVRFARPAGADKSSTERGSRRAARRRRTAS